MPEDDPADLERYWQRMRGPRPPTPEVPTPERAEMQTVLDKFREDCRRSLSGQLWGSVIIGPESEQRYGPRIPATQTGPIENDSVEVKVVYGPATEELHLIGVAIWESPEAIQALIISSFTTGPCFVQPGDSYEFNVRISI